MFRSVLFWLHLAAASFAGVVVFIMSLTGVLLTYEKRMIAWADARAAALGPVVPSTPRVSVDTIAERVRLAVPEASLTTLLRRRDPQAPVTATLSDGTIVLVNPYTGHVLREAPTTLRRFFRTTTDWHRYLAGTGESRATGKAITGATNLAFLFLILSGLYLWLPRRWSRASVSAVAIPRWRHRTSKARDFNWHNALGLWSAVPLAIVVASATVISYPWASNLVYRLVGETPPPVARPAAATPTQAGTHVPLPALAPGWAAAEAQVSAWTAVSLRVPAASGEALVFTVDEGWAGQPQKRGTLTVDGATGSVRRWETFADQTRGRQLRSMLRFAHTGEVLGIPGQTIAGVVSAVACVLTVTGFALAWRRLTAWRQRRRAPNLQMAA